MFLQPLMMRLLIPYNLQSISQGGGKVKPAALGGAPVGEPLVLFQDVSGKPVCRLHKPHILAELLHWE